MIGRSEQTAIHLDNLQQEVTWNTVLTSVSSQPRSCRFFEDIPALELSHSTLRQHLQQGLTQAFGKIGGAIPFEVLSLQQGSAIAFLKADKR